MKEEKNQQSQTKKKKGERKWLLIFFVCGVGLTIKGGYDAVQAVKSYFWVATEGKILSSSVSRIKRLNDPSSYYADITYEYEVGGEKFIGEKVFIGEYSTGNPAPIQAIVDRYPVGKGVTVYYDARNPKKAVLEKGARLASFGLLFIGLLFSAVGLGGFLLWDELHKGPQFVSRRTMQDDPSAPQGDG